MHKYTVNISFAALTLVEQLASLDESPESLFVMFVFASESVITLSSGVTAIEAKEN